MKGLGGGVAGVCCLPFGTGIASHFKSNRPLSLIGHSATVRISLCCQQQTMERRGKCMEKFFLYIYIYRQIHTDIFAATLLDNLYSINKHEFLHPSYRLFSRLLV